MREVYLVRHGQAESMSAGGDAARRLTAHGRAQVSAVTRGMSRVGVRVDALWHSPYARAVETAKLIGEGLGCENLVEEAGVVPGGDPGWVAERVAEDRTQRLMIVSHLPFLPGLVSALLQAPVRVDVGTADLVHLALLGKGPAFLRAHVPSSWALAASAAWEESR